MQRANLKKAQVFSPACLVKTLYTKLKKNKITQGLFLRIDPSCGSPLRSLYRRVRIISRERSVSRRIRLAQMVEVVIDSVRVSLTNQQRIVLLRQENLDRYLPIWIGPFEAESITISLQEIEVARPQTHDLLLKSIVALGARLIRAEVIALKGDVFYGNLVLEVNGETVNVDARPSDSIALAVRAHVPILVNREIMHEAGIVPEEDIQSELFNEGNDLLDGGAEAGTSVETEARLSLFEDFLQNIDLDDLDDHQEKPDAEAPNPDDQT